MQVQQIMSTRVEYIPADTTLAQAAKNMRDRDTGFLPIGGSPQGRLQGVITDRDITVRGVAAGKDPENTTVNQVKTDKVLYCFQNEDVNDVANNMQDQKVYRLIVLNNHDEKRLCGIVSLGDIVRHGSAKLGGETAREISQH
jgi:CBS domain-containing protein